jgi:hypothetical protein
LPAVLLDANITTAPSIVSVYICLGVVSHANVRCTFGPLGRLIVSPAFHRLHHSTEHRPGINLGVSLTVWDALTGRAVFPRRGDPIPATGLIGRPIPVEQSVTLARPASMLARQLMGPFSIPAAGRRLGS